MKFRHHRLMALSLFLLSACGGGGDAKAKVAFENESSSLMSDYNLLGSFQDGLAKIFAAPSVFKIKLIAVYLTEDIDGSQNNVGSTQFIYLNPDCDDDIMHCDISAGTAEDGETMSKIVGTYFDFGAASESVNAAINAQERAINAGTYKYARMEFCKYNSGNANNIQWAGGGVSTPREFKRNMCTVNSDVFNPPLVVAEGDSVTVTLSYDLSNSVSSGSGGDDSDSGTQFTLPTFVPSASTN